MSMQTEDKQRKQAKLTGKRTKSSQWFASLFDSVMILFD